MGHSRPPAPIFETERRRCERGLVAAADPALTLPALDQAEFACLMRPFGPPGRPIAVAVSGGADSMALALLASGWGRVTALIVDHGLRHGSDRDAALARDRLLSRGIPAQVLTLTDLVPTAHAARIARYAALEAACVSLGQLDLLFAHHRRDQAETVMMRRERGSGSIGLAGMPALRETANLRLIRPLLGIPPGRLRATLRNAGLDWSEDPTNSSPRYHRTRARQMLADPTGCSKAVEDLAEAAEQWSGQRAARDRAVAEELADYVEFRPEGWALIHHPLGPDALSSVLRAVAGRFYPPAEHAVFRLARLFRPATLAGCRILPAGRQGPGWLIVREAAAMDQPCPAVSGAVWDGRYALSDGLPDHTLGAIGAAAAGLRKLSRLPDVVIRTLPALRWEGKIVAAPQLGLGPPVRLRLIAPVPAAPAAFAGESFITR